MPPSTAGPVLLGLLLLTSLAFAQTPDDPAPFHWAYAATFGTGKYRFSGEESVVVVRVPLQWRWREPDESRRCGCGVRFLFPFTAGVAELALEEALEGGELPRRLEQASFLPGVELEFPRTQRWTLRTRAQLGWGTHRGDGADDAFIYTAGVRSRYAWPGAAGRPALVNGLQWVGFNPERGDPESALRLTSGVEFAVSVHRWQFREQTMQLMPHVLVNRYLHTRGPHDARRSLGDITEWEVGLASGREEPFAIFGFEVGRLGLAFRYSEHGSGIRIVAGSIF